VEKSIKAVLIHCGIEFRKVHDVDYLVGLLPASVPLPPAEAAALTHYAVMARYPGDYEEVTEEAYQKAVQIAQAVLIWAERIVYGTQM